MTKSTTVANTDNTDKHNSGVVQTFNSPMQVIDTMKIYSCIEYLKAATH